MFIRVAMFRRAISRVLSAEAHSHGTENTKQCNRESNSKNETFGCYGKLDQVSPDRWRVSRISQELSFDFEVLNIKPGAHVCRTSALPLYAQPFPLDSATCVVGSVPPGQTPGTWYTAATAQLEQRSGWIITWILMVSPLAQDKEWSQGKNRAHSLLCADTSPLVCCPQ